MSVAAASTSTSTGGSGSGSHLPVLSPSERSYIISGLSHPTRPTRLDGRGLKTTRNLRISYGDAPMVYGSGRVVLEREWRRNPVGVAKGKGRESEELSSAYRKASRRQNMMTQGRLSESHEIVYPKEVIPLAGLGGTEIIAGIKLEVVTVTSKLQTPQNGDIQVHMGDEASADVQKLADPSNFGDEWKCKVEVDVTPQAFPQLNSSALSALASQYSNLLLDHFVPYLPPLTILDGKKYFQPQLHLVILSATAGSVIPTLFLAARTAFANLHVPSTRSVGWEAVAGDLADANAGERIGTGMSGGEAGISGAVRVKTQKKGPQRGGPSGGDDWDLEDLGGGDEGEGELLADDVRKGLPICVTLNLVAGSKTVFLDATLQEESACPLRLHLFFCSRPAERIDDTEDRRVALCGMRLEGEDGLSTSRLQQLLLDGEKIAGQMLYDLNSDMLSTRNR